MDQRLKQVFLYSWAHVPLVGGCCLVVLSPADLRPKIKSRGKIQQEYKDDLSLL